MVTLSAFERHAGPLLLPMLLLLVLSAAAAASASAAAAAPLPAAPGPPKLDLAKWNQAYKITIANVTEENLKKHPALYTQWNDCSEEGYDKPTAMNLSGARPCFQKKHSNGTVTAWMKLPGDRRQYASSYCYALDIFNGSRCLPGAANGTDEAIGRADKITCDLMKQAHLLYSIRVSTDGCNPYDCWETDYTLARKDSNRLWSWKKPDDPATNKDLYGKLIKDPEATNVTVYHDVFCGYYHVVPSEMTVATNGTRWTDLSINDRVKHYVDAKDEDRLPDGAAVWAEPLPYNETTYGAFVGISARQREEGRLWESKRGSKEWQEWYSKKGPNGKGSASPSPNSSGRKLLM